MPDRTLVTGALGCLGAWTLKALIDDGEDPVAYDLGDDTHRLQLVLEGDELKRITLVKGDVADSGALGRALDEYEVNRVVHLAALQVPLCKADPALGARVNMLGTVCAFEAVKDRGDRIAGIAYASSTAVYNASDPSPAPEVGGSAPSTLYGVTKLANEGTARVYWQDHGVASIGIRPYVAYGPGRDFGLTSGPTVALAAAIRGEPYEIDYGGTAQYDFAPDVGRAFARAARAATEGSHVANFPGVVATMPEVVAAIEDAVPDTAGTITFRDDPLPFPAELEAEELERLVGPLPRTLLVDGMRRTADVLRRGV